MDDLAFKSAVEQAALVRARAVTPVELVEAALRRIERLDESLHAFVEVDGERALAAAAALGAGEGLAFPGVPVAIKANVPVAGMSMTLGSRYLADHRPDHSAYLVRRLREAGFVVVGVTNMPEFGILPTTEPRHTGPTHNPWDDERTPGGSSGGSAAAVAAGLVPVAHGNDGGGSIRIPAACCGLVGLKPSRGRISSGPELGDSYLTTNGVLTRTIADTALALDVLSGYEVGDATWAPKPTEPFAHAMRRAPGRLRVAMTTGNPLGIEADPECERAMRDTGALLSDLGHEVEDASPAFPGREFLRLFADVFGTTVSLGVLYGERLAGHPPEEDELEPLTRAVLGRAQDTSAVRHLATVAQLQALARALVAFFADYDVLLTPALAERPLRIGECNGLGEDPWADLARSGRFTPYTSMFNVTGQPAIALPAGLGADGLPVAVQLAGKPLGEETLLAVAAQLETARPWAHERPAFATA